VEFTGVRTGDRTLPGIIADLFRSGDVLLGLTLVFFWVLFPALKILLAVWITVAGRRSLKLQRSLMKLLSTAKNWSMADVFLIALVVIFFKAEGVHLQFVARDGLYCFAVAAILSSVAVFLLERSQRRAMANQLRLLAAQVGALEPSGSSALSQEVLDLAEELRPLFSSGRAPRV